MVFEIGVNLRVTECLDKGDRNYMEDFCKCYFEKVDGSIVFGFFAIFDGHGGSEAANFAKNMLINEIKKLPLFWSKNDEDVLLAIKEGFASTHRLMWKERENWSKTISGFDSTAGTTATVAIVRNKKLYIGHVGDSACVLGFSKVVVSRTDTWDSICLTVEHKPSNIVERKRIEKSGGTLAKKAGVQRVVWSRPKLHNPHQDLIEGDSIELEHVPFLAVTRSLGDLWSYDSQQDVYHISPEPDVQCISLNTLEHRCLILGSDGLWNVVSTQAAIELIRICERETERRVFLDPNINSNFFYNPAASLVRYSLSQWKRLGMRADNVSALVIMIDPPGPSMTKRREDRRKSNFSALDILSSLISETPSNENFSKQLTKEFLIECSRWRSANELKNEIETVDGKLKIVQDTKCEHDSSYCLSNATNGNRSVDKKITKSSEKKTPIEIPITNLLSKNFITSDSHYVQFCISWINNPKVWAFVSFHFQSKGLTNEVDIMEFLDSIDPTLSGEILRLMPWIFVAKNAFKSNTKIQVSINSVPLFNHFWIELYDKHIKSLEKSSTPMQQTNMQAIINILKPNILSLLKQYNYLVSLPNSEKSCNQYESGEDNRNNEIQLRSQKTKYSISDSTGKNKKSINHLNIYDNNGKLKFLGNSNSKSRISKIAKIVQFNKENQKIESFILKKSASDKHIMRTLRSSDSPSATFEIMHDLPLRHKQTESSPKYRFRRRYSTLNASNSLETVFKRNMRKSNYQDTDYIFCLRKDENNKNNSHGKPSRSLSALSGHHSYRQFNGKRSKIFQNFY